MDRATPLPDDLAQRYRDWRAKGFPAKAELYETLVRDGQSPVAMMISCSDSRVSPTTLFGTDPGDFFVHRNVASLVPPHDPDGDFHGTAAAVEFAVGSLKVPHLIVMGHSGCGGVAGCHAMCSGDAPHLEKRESYLGRWIGILKPGYERMQNAGTGDVGALEKEAVRLSLRNLMSYPFVSDAVEAGRLELHGLWNDIGAGGIEMLSADGSFAAL